MAKDNSGTCPLCGRTTQLTFHHLIPKKLHRRDRFRKRYTKAQLNEGVFVCRLCHNGIHDHYDEMTLGQRFSRFELLEADANIQRHAQWVAKQKVRP